MNAIVNRINHRVGEQADRVMAYVGLFLIGAITQGAEIASHATRSMPKTENAAVK